MIYTNYVQHHDIITITIKIRKFLVVLLKHVLIHDYVYNVQCHMIMFTMYNVYISGISSTDASRATIVTIDTQNVVPPSNTSDCTFK